MQINIFPIEPQKVNVEQIPTAKVARWLTTWKLREKKAGTRRETSSLILTGLGNPRKDGRSPALASDMFVRTKNVWWDLYIFTKNNNIYFDKNKESFIDIGLHTLHMFVLYWQEQKTFDAYFSTCASICLIKYPNLQGSNPSSFHKVVSQCSDMRMLWSELVLIKTTSSPRCIIFVPL